MILFIAPFLIYGFFEARGITVRQYTTYFEDLPSEFDGYSILHLSDFHFNGYNTFTRKATDILPNLPSDIAVITGDFRNKAYTKWDKAIPPIKQVLESINSRQGIYGCLGNKETSRSVRVLESLGLHILRNTNVQIKKGNQSIYLLGVDETNPLKKFSTDCVEAMQNVPAGSFKILLAHSPDYVIYAKHFGIHLMLAGDTHGGQISLPFIGAPRVKSKLSRKYAKGWINTNGTSLYVNSGIGSVNIPIRVMCPPEIVRIILKKGRL